MSPALVTEVQERAEDKYKQEERARKKAQIKKWWHADDYSQSQDGSFNVKH